MSNVPIIPAVKAAWSFQRLHWRRVGGVLGLMAVVDAAGAAMASLAPDPPVWTPLLALASVGLVAVAYMGLMRMALQDEHPDDPEFEVGPLGFQWGKPEWRFVGLALLIAFVMLLAFLVLIFAAMVVVAGSALGNLASAETPQAFWESLGPNGQGIMSVLALLYMAGALFFSIRLSLAPAATVARRRIALFETWPLTKGQFFRIFAATLLTVFPPLLLAGILAGVVGGLTGAPTEIGQKAAFMATFPAALTSSVIQAFVILPLSTGLTAFLYRGLRDKPDA